MKTSTAKRDKQTEELPAAPEREEDTSMTAAMGPDELGGFSGDVQTSMIKRPRINIIQPMSDLSDSYPNGTILYDKSIIAATSASEAGQWGQTVEVTILRADQTFQENIEFNKAKAEGLIPKQVAKLEQVHALGGTIEWGTDGKEPSWIPKLDVVMLLKANSDETRNAYIYEYKGDRYDLAQWTITKTAFNRVGQTIITARYRRLCDRDTGKSLLHHGRWALSTRKDPKCANPVWSPRLQPLENHPPEFIEEFLPRLLG